MAQDFNWTYPNSGSPWLTGDGTVMTPSGPKYKAISDRDLIIRAISGAQPAYLTMLNSRYLYDPSGWNS